jgi:YD repeat-containing protein
VAAARAVLEALAERGSPQLRADLEPVLKQLDSFVGHTPAEIWKGLEKEAEEQREKPAGGEAGPPQSSLLLPDLSLLLMVPLVVATLGRRKKWQRWTTPLAVVLLAVAVMGFGATAAQAGEPVAEAQRPALSELVLSDVLSLVLSPVEGLSKGRAEGSGPETLAGSGFPLAPVPAALPSNVSSPASSPAANVQAAETITTTRVISYTYDPLGRLIDAEYSTGEQFEYQYDAVGNRLLTKPPSRRTLTMQRTVSLSPCRPVTLSPTPGMTGATW